jgi:hypothetical protein
LQVKDLVAERYWIKILTLMVVEVVEPALEVLTLLQMCLVSEVSVFRLLLMVQRHTLQGVDLDTEPNYNQQVLQGVEELHSEAVELIQAEAEELVGLLLVQLVLQEDQV